MSLVTPGSRSTPSGEVERTSPSGSSATNSGEVPTGSRAARNRSPSRSETMAANAPRASSRARSPRARYAWSNTLALDVDDRGSFPPARSRRLNSRPANTTSTGPRRATEGWPGSGGPITSTRRRGEERLRPPPFPDELSSEGGRGPPEGSNLTNHRPRSLPPTSSERTLPSRRLAIPPHQLLRLQPRQDRADLLLQPGVLHVELLQHPGHDPAFVLAVLEQLPDTRAGPVQLEDLVGVHVDEDHAVAGHLGHHLLAGDPPLRLGAAARTAGLSHRALLRTRRAPCSRKPPGRRSGSPHPTPATRGRAASPARPGPGRSGAGPGCRTWPA